MNTQQQGTSFTDGILAPFRAIAVIRQHPSLLKYTIIPIVINTIILGLGTWFIIANGTTWLQNVIPSSATWLVVILTIVQILFILTVIVLVVYAFSALARIIAAPFHDQLSIAVERIYGIRENKEPLRVIGLFKDAVRTIHEEIMKVLFFGAIQLVTDRKSVV